MILVPARRRDVNMTRPWRPSAHAIKRAAKTAKGKERGPKGPRSNVRQAQDRISSRGDVFWRAARCSQCASE